MSVTVIYRSKNPFQTFFLFSGPAKTRPSHGSFLRRYHHRLRSFALLGSTPNRTIDNLTPVLFFFLLRGKVYSFYIISVHYHLTVVSCPVSFPLYRAKWRHDSDQKHSGDARRHPLIHYRGNI
jgi:hypothetical protein